MKRILTILTLFLLAFSCQAQVNPKRGYIITNGGDSIHGTIDYRSDSRNCQECTFRADGSEAFVTYRPDDIRGYRFKDDGVYYVTRVFPVDDVDTKVFTEYIIQGGVSLFFYSGRGQNYYYFVDENGKVAVMKEIGQSRGSSEETLAAKRASMLQAQQMLAKSPETTAALWKSNYDRRALARLTREYDEKYCASWGDCIQFEYDAKATSAIQVKGIRVEAGLSALGKARFDGTENVLSKGTIAGEEKIFYEERPVKRSLTLTAPEVAVGIDLAFPRFSRNLTAQVLIGYSYMKAEDEVMERTFDGSRTREELVTCKMTASDLFLEVGLAYSFIPDAKISPVVRGGLEIDNFFSGKTENMKQYHIHTDMTGHKHNTSFGAYLGAGADFAIGRHTMRLMAGVKGIGIVGNVWDFNSYSPEIRLGWLF